MDIENIRARYLAKLLQGDRVACRSVIGETLQTGTPATVIYTELFWPVMAQIDQLYRAHNIDRITQQMATRINRTLVDQLQSKLPCREERSLSMIVLCAEGEPEELGAQMCADLFESDGWRVTFLGGGIPNDEIVEMIGVTQPDIVFVYGTKPQGAPGIRQLIDTVRNIGASPKTRIMLSGGVFNRAEGLWDEIGADLFAPTAAQAMKIALTDRRADSGRKRNKKQPTSKGVSRTCEDAEVLVG